MCNFQIISSSIFDFQCLSIDSTRFLPSGNHADDQDLKGMVKHQANINLPISPVPPKNVSEKTVQWTRGFLVPQNGFVICSGWLKPSSFSSPTGELKIIHPPIPRQR